MSVPAIWLQFLILGLVGFFLGRRTWWAGLAVVIVIIPGALSQLSELHDPFVGPDILAEAGRGYFLQSYAAMMISFCLALGGTIVGMRGRKRKS